jgi:hypothetical protein
MQLSNLGHCVFVFWGNVFKYFDILQQGAKRAYRQGVGGFQLTASWDSCQL